MTEKNDNSLGDAIDGHLDDFFADAEPAESAPSDKPDGTEDDLAENAPNRFSLRNLKEILLSIEWEITDEHLENLIDETSQLKNRFSEDLVSQSLLQIIGTIGAYIHQKKSRAHPDSFQLLHSVFHTLENVSAEEQMDEIAKRDALVREVTSLKQLKETILATMEKKPGEQQLDEAVLKLPADNGIENETTADFEPMLETFYKRIEREMIDPMRATLKSEIMDMVKTEIASLKKSETD